MRTTKVPKILFHGASALAGHLSYTVGRELTKLHQQNPQAAKKLLDSAQAKYFFPEFGPGFPDTNYERDICLTQNIAEANSFANCKGEVLVPGYIHLTNPGGSRVTLMPQNYLHFPQAHQLLMGVTERLYKDAGRRATHPIPGAILLLDAEALEEGGLLIDREGLVANKIFNGEHLGEESNTAGYLPWKFIRGILYVHPSPLKVTSFWFRDSEIQHDLNDYLDTTPFDPHRLFRPNAMTCHEQMSKSNTPWQKYLD